MNPTDTPGKSQAPSQEALREKLIDSFCGGHLGACDEEGECCCIRGDFTKDLDALLISRERAAYERAAPDLSARLRASEQARERLETAVRAFLAEWDAEMPPDDPITKFLAEVGEGEPKALPGLRAALVPQGEGQGGRSQ